MRVIQHEIKNGDDADNGTVVHAKDFHPKEISCGEHDHFIVLFRIIEEAALNERI